MLFGRYLNRRLPTWLAISYLCLAGLLSSCSTHLPAPVQDAVHKGSYRVNSGDTLYSIAFRYGLDYRYLATINHLRSPYKIIPGQQLRLSTSKTLNKGHKSHLAAVKPYSKSTVQLSSNALSNRLWRWPAQGQLISSFSPLTGGNKGIDIGGQYGQPVYAAAAGTVVYCGNGLHGYGQLIIIKHDDIYLSAYAHNSQLLVKEDMHVKAGQQIAKMGNSDSSRIKLHFEIRKAGKPVNPLIYLHTPKH